LPAITIVEPGPLTTVQDLGRYGFQDRGVPVSGAMDLQAIRVGNRLVGNAEDAAALEITLGGFCARFEHPLTIAVTGADLGPTVQGQPLAGFDFVANRLQLGMRCQEHEGCLQILPVAAVLDVAQFHGPRGGNSQLHRPPWGPPPATDSQSSTIRS